MTIHLVLWKIEENQYSHNLHTLYMYLLYLGARISLLIMLSALDT